MPSEDRSKSYLIYITPAFALPEEKEQTKYSMYWNGYAKVWLSEVESLLVMLLPNASNGLSKLYDCDRQTDRHTEKCSYRRNRLRCTKLFGLNIIKVTWVRCRIPAAWMLRVRTRDCWRWWSCWWRKARRCGPRCATQTDWSDWPGTVRHWHRCTRIWHTSRSRRTAGSWTRTHLGYPSPASASQQTDSDSVSQSIDQTLNQYCPAGPILPRV